jgi:hypothetical protein
VVSGCVNMQRTKTSVRLVLGLLAAAFWANQASVGGQTTVFINEILANNATVQDLNGNTPDWVELYNASAGEINLAGMSLTTDPTNPRRWVFPEGITIRGHDFKVIYFDGNLAASPFNTGFGLGANGDAVYLYDQSTNRVDGVAFGLQVQDLSIGRLQVAGGAWALMKPTLGAPNEPATLGSASNLKINEWMADPASGSDWFELYSPDPNPVAIGGLYLSNALKKNPYKYRIPDLSYVGSGALGFQKFVADDASTNGANHTNFKLSKGGDEVGLFSALGSAIDSVQFSAQATGVSEGRLPDGAANIVRFAATPTPGASNFQPLTSVVINEILTHTDPPEEDALELYNPGSADVAIGGFYLSDSPSNFKKFQIPAGTVVAAHGYIVFYGHQFTNGPAPFTFNSSEGDSVYLSAADAAGNLTGYRAPVQFDAAANGVSFGRYTNSTGAIQYPAQAAVTLGAANSGPRVGPVVITEIMYEPVPILGTNDNTADEFVEIHNITAQSVPLFNQAEPTNSWRLWGGVNYYFPSGAMLPPGGYAVLVSFNPSTDAGELSAFRTKFGLGTDTLIWGPFNKKLGNSGDTVQLQMPDSVQGLGHINQGFVPYILVDQIDYTASAPWPSGASATGESLQRSNASAYGNDPANWVVALPTAGRATAGQAIADQDGDQMPDDWELAHGLNPNDPADAALDNDGDGLTNLQEYWAGTDPRDPASTFKIESAERISGGLLIRFTAVAGKTYAVQSRNLTSGGLWQTLKNIEATLATSLVEVSLPIDAGQGASSYRLVTPSSP